MMATLSGLVSSPPNVGKSGGRGTRGTRGAFCGTCSFKISSSRIFARSFLLNFRKGCLVPEAERSRDLLRRRKLKEPLRCNEPFVLFPPATERCEFSCSDCCPLLTTRNCCPGLEDLRILAGKIDEMRCLCVEWKGRLKRQGRSWRQSDECWLLSAQLS